MSLYHSLDDNLWSQNDPTKWLKLSLLFIIEEIFFCIKICRSLNINSEKVSTYFRLEARRTLSSFFNRKFYSCRFCLHYASLQLSIPLSWSFGLCWDLYKNYDLMILIFPFLFLYFPTISCGPSIIHKTRKFNWFSLFSVQSVKLKI